MKSGDADDAEQGALRDKAFKTVRERGFFLRQARDNGDIDGVLKESVEMLKELRTGDLTPKFYYEVYMEILNELRYLETFFLQLVSEKTKTSLEIYEMVQSVSNVVPRLYLLVTAGSVVMRTGSRPNHEVLNDLVSMCKGVQHPTRGLFLRNYLTISTRDKLPDASSDPSIGTVADGYNFVLQNFGETNRLWVRLQHQGSIKSKQKRFQIRQDLRMLVGQNIDRLSRLDGVGVQEYIDVILPKILEHVIKCRDVLAQSYLMDILIQVFPDDFHFATMTQFLSVVPQLKDRVNVRSILEALMSRLSAYVVAGRQIGEDRLPEEPHAYGIMNETVLAVVKRRPNMQLTEILRLGSALLDYSMKCYPDVLEYINSTIGFAAEVLHAKMHPEPELDENGRPKTTEPVVNPLTEEAIEQIEHLLSVPLDSLALRVLELPKYSSLLGLLPWENRRAVAVALTRAILAGGGTIKSVDEINQLFELLVPVLRDPTDEEAAVDSSAAMALQQAALSAEGEWVAMDEDAQSNFETEQLLIARLVHLLRCDEASQLHAMYLEARRSFGLGGVRRIQYTLVPLVFGELQLIPRLKEAESEAWELRTAAEKAKEKVDAMAEDDPERPAALSALSDAEAATSDRVFYTARKGFQFIHEIVTAMAPSYPEMALKLFLQSAVSADRLEYADIAYEFMTQAFIIYEEMLSDSRAQVRALQNMIGTMLLCRSYPDGDFDSIVTNLAQHCATLLKKPDQCRMVSMVSHLFWTAAPSTEGAHCDGRRVLECLQRALKIADACMASSMNVHLFVEILNCYIYYFESDVPDITDTYLSGLIELIKEHLENMEPGQARSAVQTHFANTIRHIKHKQQLPETAAKFRNVQV